MKVLIAYATRYGCTGKAACKLAEYPGEDVRVVNLVKENTEDINLNDYDVIAIGGSIYTGKIQKEVKQFCMENIDIIIQKKLGLFICCGLIDQIDEQMNNAFEERLMEHAVVKSHFGYEFNFDKMNFLSRVIVKKLARISESKSVIEEDNIKDFADKLFCN